VSQCRALPTQVVEESLLIFGWVANWRPIEIFLYEWWPIVRRRNLYRRLAAAEVDLTPFKGKAGTRLRSAPRSAGCLFAIRRIPIASLRGVNSARCLRLGCNRISSGRACTSNARSPARSEGLETSGGRRAQARPAEHGAVENCKAPEGCCPHNSGHQKQRGRPVRLN
jgi:hypothetical protein